MPSSLQPGLKCSLSLTITNDLIVPALAGSLRGFTGMPPVFATAFMVGFIEWACIEALRSHLQEGQGTVGTHIDVSHCAATPVGLTARAHVELLAIEGRSLRFAVACQDDRELIGEGSHERHIIDVNTFSARMDGKRRQHAVAQPLITRTSRS